MGARRFPITEALAGASGLSDTDRRKYLRAENREGEAPAEP